MDMSEQGIFGPLTSEYVGQFSDEAAQYAIDNIDADCNAKAPGSAETYSAMLHTSKQGFFDQLASEFGGQFTVEQEDYAIANLNS